MTKHIPGPWDIIHRDPPIKGGYDESIYRDNGGTHTLIADVYGRDNAQLIKAAPDLLVACEKAYNAFTSRQGGLQFDAERALLAAIRKARGEGV